MNFHPILEYKGEELDEEEVHKKLRKERLPKNKMKKFHKHSGFNECYPLEMLDKLMEELDSV